MGRILNTLERITNQSGLSAGISDVSDVELLVSTLPTDSKEILKRVDQHFTLLTSSAIWHW